MPEISPTNEHRSSRIDQSKYPYLSVPIGGEKFLIKQKIRLRYVRKRIQAVGMMLFSELKMVSGTGFEPVLPP
jgi:hypothetical protein